MTNRNRVPSLEGDRPRQPPRTAGPVSRPRPAGGLGLLLVHNITATAVARAAVQAGTDPKLIPFAPALALIRDRVTADACCPHCGLRPVPAKAQASALIDDIARLPRHRPGRQRTSGRTAAERRNGRTENVTYTITIEESNLPEWDSSPNT
ncbi:MAG TPA: hypothetical protein VHZ03_23680 [Trebonia sp.]|jgi:hypothetical protein|nr:hypothetical protein [Trebonia sp.]